ncbi:uncharacterized protein B0T15DRAFT_56830 [Chaetomium strumarium]|uniref:Uncharacterized protein n=1 Tax=Chaetomium strumarium TaxID=1170767 RepID=A0AAJ0H3P1_9PEZI|nr:hypothetical protein B0T15DRAFT_56830 [Chaetomium strumarium]
MTGKVIQATPSLMDSQTSYADRSWTMSFVEAAQRERRRREEHTTDVQQSILAYRLAAERKIEDAFRVNLFVPSSGRPTTLPARPKTKPK